ncbi:hypothetical protein BDN70DRAFT_167387 [Pholiota conissans]|uniref:Uncharacterized protein n=1 Tax=Pholiota conissans TaxID=109636 RepID=A0A9P5YVZ8_9AGAR|nr:hypothetical protein BDN70DRAFT_167387 [Pholiota conissans]
MSLFVRPDSPPPRQPSPDILPVPLPYPHHPRRIASQPKIRVHSPGPLVPPGLQGRNKTLYTARSCDFPQVEMPREKSPFSDDGHSSIQSARERTHSTATPTLTVSSVPNTPSSSRPPSVKSSLEFAPRHRRTMSVAFPNPPASPSLAQNERSLSVPEVPYRYTGPRRIVLPQPVSTTPVIMLPDIDQPGSEVRFPPRTTTEKPRLPPLEKHKSMGVACLKFFGIRSASRRPPNDRVVA